MNASRVILKSWLPPANGSRRKTPRICAYCSRGEWGARLETPRKRRYFVCCDIFNITNHTYYTQVAAYFIIFFLPPSMGNGTPRRFFHLLLSQLPNGTKLAKTPPLLCTISARIKQLCRLFCATSPWERACQPAAGLCTVRGMRSRGLRVREPERRLSPPQATLVASKGDPSR